MHQSDLVYGRAAVPARVTESIFSDLESQKKMKARWISVNTSATSIDHESKMVFVKQAAQECASGKGEKERVENGVYQRAGAISLMHHGCLP